MSRRLWARVKALCLAKMAPIIAQHRPVQGPFASLADRTPDERLFGPVDKPSAP